MKNIEKTWLFTGLLSLATIITAAIVQLRGEKGLSLCSYLDPIIVDVLAFASALFLIIEGSYRIMEHSHAPLKLQFTRSIRIAFGFAILTLHIMQFLHK